MVVFLHFVEVYLKEHCWVGENDCCEYRYYREQEEILIRQRYIQGKRKQACLSLCTSYCVRLLSLSLSLCV